MFAQNSLSRDGLLAALDAERQLETLKSGLAAAAELDWLFEEVRLDDLASYPGAVLPVFTQKKIQGMWTYTACG